MYAVRGGKVVGDMVPGFKRRDTSMMGDDKMDPWSTVGMYSNMEGVTTLRVDLLK